MRAKQLIEAYTVSDQSAELVALEKEIDRLEDQGGHDHALRLKREEFRKKSKQQEIWNRKQKFPRLFAKLRAAVD